MSDPELIYQLLLFVLLLVFSGIFSATETAYFSLSEVDIKRLENKKFKNIKIIKNLLSDPQRLLIVIVLGNMFVNVFSSSITANIAIGFFGNKGIGISIGLMTFLLLVFGEITPKSIAISYNEKFSQFMAKPVYYFSVLVKPLVSLIIIITERVMNLYGVTSYKNSNQIAEEDLKNVVNISESEGMIEEDEKELINSIFEFGTTIVREIMVPRIDMICLETQMNSKEVFDIIKEHQFSRYPVYEDTKDDIIGMLYIKDLLEYIKSSSTVFEIKKLVRPVFFIPETERISHLLKVMQENKIVMALVVDEYGGTEGIVTMEDIMEEIFGEILDEVEEQEIFIRPVGDGKFRLEGNTPIDLIEEEIGIYIPSKGYETISGFILEKLGKIPKGGEVILDNKIKYKVEQVERNRICSILVIMPHNRIMEEN